ncbi:hypothetical protein LOTGIDRAFT_216125 [Lottia gigantea]|uniref:Fibronectin type III-like domain-containing protein n=1 Tax=Lottia gigantea TaxID=225164 RepID=V4ADV1_LOTGI|nr:hypothetical protein LOTGIDRAFT_216125 [Lottia gigantea]ESO93305.1 hypothetical protein LOTGIDRAFT_216125 [Lottia gigantea]
MKIPWFLCLVVFLFTETLLAIYPFQNVSLSFEERTDDLVQRLTLDEIVVLMTKGGGGKYGGPQPAIPRLGIKKFQWDSECLRGDGYAGNATSFPQAIGLAASFSTGIIQRVADATSIEVRGKHNDFVKHGNWSDHTGLGCFSPVINIMRHPLWGRNQETYGEDPYLSGILARSFIKGLTGNHPRYIRTSSTCKHFDAYGGPENKPVSRQTFDAKVSERDLRTTFLPQFQHCVDGGAYGLMCSYNSVNGVPNCANSHFMTDILRKDWGFNGYIISDAGALEFMLFFHKGYFNTTLQAAVGSVKAGLNLELGPGGYKQHVFDQISEGLKKGLLSEQLVRERVRPLMYTRMKLGDFDPIQMNPYNYLNTSVIQSQKHQDISILAAVQSFVLLKNDGLLPLTEMIGTLAVVGPMSNNPTQLLGDYSANVDERFISTPLKGLSTLGKEVNHADGCNMTSCLQYDKTEIITAVKSADLTIVCLGTGQALETENVDRTNLSLPGKQQDLLKDVIKHTKGRILVLIFSGGPLDINQAVESNKVSAIFQCFFPAQSTGIALYRSIKLVSPVDNPGARLPYTWYHDMSQVPNMTDYTMTEKTYRYFTGKPLFPFGYGLSYSSFKYSNLEIDPPSITSGSNVTVSFIVVNTGQYDGDEVCQMYISWLNSTVITPHYQLVGFKRVHLTHDQPVKVVLYISSQQMAVWIDNKGFIVQPGIIKVYVGGQSPGHQTSITSNELVGQFTIT